MLLSRGGRGIVWAVVIGCGARTELKVLPDGIPSDAGVIDRIGDAPVGDFLVPRDASDALLDGAVDGPAMKPDVSCV
jgi:hypothetical protein